MVLWFSPSWKNVYNILLQKDHKYDWLQGNTMKFWKYMHEMGYIFYFCHSVRWVSTDSKDPQINNYQTYLSNVYLRALVFWENRIGILETIEVYMTQLYHTMINQFLLWLYLCIHYKDGHKWICLWLAWGDKCNPSMCTIKSNPAL